MSLATKSFAVWAVLGVAGVLFANYRQVRENGFSVTIPEGWNVQTLGKGQVVLSSRDASRLAVVTPVFGRGINCESLLRDASSPAWGTFPGARTVAVTAVPGNARLHVARFTFRNGAGAGALLCAQTSSQSAMAYAIAAPAASFSSEVPTLVAALKSFRFGSEGRMVTWQEPNEHAYTFQVPEGWRVMGGLKRLDVTHWTSGVEVSSPEGSSVLRFGDPRLRQCSVPGPGMAGMPGGGQGSGLNLCGYVTGQQASGPYLQTLARDWNLDSLQVGSNTNRSDLGAEADRLPRQFGLNVQTTVAEIRFRAMRRGSPVEGMLLMSTSFFGAVSGQNFTAGTLSTNALALLGPPPSVPGLAVLLGVMSASIRWNLDWYQMDQRISREIAQRTLGNMQATAENQNKAFWERMVAADQRRDAVNDLLGGTVRLAGGDGQTLQAKAGSNYYFLDTEAARRVSRPEEAVRGMDVYPSPAVDLQPLEVIR